MTELDQFAESYLRHWEERATVRSARRYALTEAAAAEDLFPPVMEPLVADRRVAALGADARRFVLTQAAYGFMQEIALLETDNVGLLAAALAHREHRVPLSSAVCQAALTVSVDEAYHAFAAREFMERAIELTGIAPVALPREHAQIGIAHAAVRPTLPGDVADDFDVIVLCMAENVITREVLGMTQEAPPDNPFHVVCDEHLADETRHNAYFQRVLRHYWAALDERTRAALGQALTLFFDRFLADGSRFRARSVATLRAAGLGAQAADEVVAEVYRPFPPAAHPMAWNLVQLLERTGVLQHRPTRAALAAGGWLGESSSAPG